ncbi:universal stress protein [soil metagenome]|jgi:nucleotide-binding universal stress UspA family protein
MSLFPTNILLATDGSDNSLPALRAAADLSASSGSGIQVIYVGKGISKPANYNDPNSKDRDAAQKARDLIDGQIKEIEERGGTVAESHVVPGDKPAKEIVKFTREQDIGIVVVGSRGLSRLQYALQGSVSSQVVRDAYCPVLVVHGDHEL